MTENKERSKRYLYNAGFIAYFCIILALVFLRLVIYLAFQYLPQDSIVLEYLDKYVDYIFTFVAQILIMALAPILVIALLFKKGFKGTMDYLQVKKPKPYIYLAFAIGVCGYVINIIISVISDTFFGFFGWQAGTGEIRADYPVWLLLISILFTAVLPGICEEITHRGLVLKTMKEGGASDKKIILINGVFFGLFHMYLGQTAFTMVMGCIMALLVIKSKSIIPAIFMHFINNFISVMISFIYSNVNLTESAAIASGVIILLLAPGAIAGFVLFILLFIKKARKAGDCPPKKKKIPQPNMQYGTNPFAPPPPVVHLSSQPQHFAPPVQPLCQSANPDAFFQTEPVTPGGFKPKARDNIFFWATIILAGLITFISFLTGI